MRGKRRSGGDSEEDLPAVCTAPPYNVVLACVRIGFHKPLDVRWSKARCIGRDRICPYCRRDEVPELAKFEFTMSTSPKFCLWLTQCRDCLTMFWEEM